LDSFHISETAEGTAMTHSEAKSQGIGTRSTQTSYNNENNTTADWPRWLVTHASRLTNRQTKIASHTRQPTDQDG